MPFRLNMRMRSTNYIQQIYSDTYDVYDENGNPKYFVKNEIVALLHRIHVSDMQDNEIGIIKQNFTLFILRFEMEMGG